MHTTENLNTNENTIKLKETLLSKLIFNKKALFLRHLFFWSGLCFSEIISIYQWNEPMSYILKYSICLLIHILIISIHIYYFIPKFLLKNKLTLYIFITIIQVTFFTTLSTYLLQEKLNHLIDKSFSLFFISNLTLNSIIIGIAISIKLLKMWYKMNIRIKNYQIEKLNTELKITKNHINPHFLLNSLNNVLVMHKINHPETENSILGLSELLKYQLYFCSFEKVPLKKEIEYIQNFNKLEKIRKTDLDLIFTINGLENIHQKFIEPFLFTPFIENSFRFLRKNNNNYFIHIHLEIKKDSICFSIKNSISNNFKPSLIDEIECENIKKRFKLLFGDKFKIRTENEIDSYKIELEIEKLSA